MKTQTLTITELKKIGRLKANQDLVVRMEDRMRKHLKKPTIVGDKSIYVKSKKRAIELAQDCEVQGLKYSIQINTF